MKGIIILLCLHAALSAPADAPADAPAEVGKVKYDIDVDVGKITYESDLNDLNYAYRLETSDGTVKHEKGHFEEENLVVEGGYEYVGDNGLKYSVVYVADKDGYRPKVSFGTKGGSVGPTITGRSAAPSAPAAPAAPAEPAASAEQAVSVSPEIPVPEIKSEEIKSLVGEGGEEEK